MRGDRKSFKPQPEELKLGSSENLPTFEDALKHGQFLKETKYLKQNAKWKHIPIDVAEKLNQIWIQDFGIPESCLRSTLSTGKAFKDQFKRCSTYGNLNPDLQKLWMAKIGTIIDPYKCRCKIELNPSQTEYYHPDCKCQDLHKIPKDKLEFVYKTREKSERIRFSYASVMAENRKNKSLKSKEAAVRIKERKRVKEKEEKEESEKERLRIEEEKVKNSIFLSQPQPRQNYRNLIKKEDEFAEKLCDHSISSPLISDIEVAQNSIKIESSPDIKEEIFD